MCTTWGGSSTFDPDTAGNAVKQFITPGLPWTQVLDRHEPSRMRIFRKISRKVDGEPVEVIEQGPMIQFDAGLFRNDFQAGNMPQGFIWYYTFSHQVSFSVQFDAAGNVVSVQDEKTLADLLDARQGG